MFLAVPGAVPLQALLAGDARHRARRGRRGGVQLPRRAEDRRDHGAHEPAAAAARRAHLAADAASSPGVIGGIGLAILYHWVNPLTMWLTLATFVGYAIVYTVILKPMTPQNIVIGGASGAMPPVLGWAAVTGEVTADALHALPHHLRVDAAAFLGARALPQARIRASAGVPMLPVTHGDKFTRLHVLLYTRDPVRVLAAAVRRAHERRSSTSAPRSCSTACSSRTRCASTRATATRSRGAPSATRSLSRGALRRAAGRPLLAASVLARGERAAARSRVGARAAAAAALAGCDKLVAPKTSS